MRILCTILLGMLATAGWAQWDYPVTFENEGEVTNWSTFANNELPNDLKWMENPDKGGINTSDYCCEFTIDPAATAWVGAWSNSYGYTAFTTSRHTLEVMVYSTSIHTIGVRGQNPLEPGAGTYGNMAEASMTKTGEWELLTLDLSASSGFTYSTLAFFADRNENRTQGSVLYWDNLGWVETLSTGNMAVGKLKVYPNPAVERITVEVPGMQRITISNVSGQRVLVLESAPVDSRSLDLSSLEAGLYILHIETEQGPVTTRIIKH